MTADYTALEARVNDLEKQVRCVIPPKIEALTYLVSIAHEDTRAIRAEVTSHSETLASHSEILAGHSETLALHTEMLGQILQRLPDPAQS
jgi:hypothetical protein